jgi:hypothetical protein
MDFAKASRSGSQPYLVLAALLVAAAVLTWFGPRLPIFELAGNIKAD